MSMLSYEKNILNFKRQLSFGGLSVFNLKKLAGRKPDGVVVCGMGGSGLPGLILKKLAGELKLPVPVVIVRDGKLPPLYFKKPLFIVISFSGETAETLAVLNSALKLRNRAGIAVITSGGKLGVLAKKNRLPTVTFNPQNLTPRESSATMFSGIVKVLKELFPIRISLLSALEPSGLRKLGNSLARTAKNRNILIYTDSSFDHLGYIWKTNLNETAKIPAFNNVYPELYHNEIAGFEKASGAWMIFWLKGKLSAAENGKIKLISKILGAKNIKTVEIPLKGRNRQEKTWNGVILSHWVSLYLAEMNKVDPRETKIIQKLKG